MTRTKKVLVTVAMIVGTAAGAAAPAMANTHVTETPDNTHVTGVDAG